MTGIESSGFWAAVSVAFMQGFVGSLHCVGMCGPFVHLLNGRSATAAKPREQDKEPTPSESNRSSELVGAGNVAGERSLSSAATGNGASTSHNQASASYANPSFEARAITGITSTGEATASTGEAPTSPQGATAGTDPATNPAIAPSDLSEKAKGGSNHSYGQGQNKPRLTINLVYNLMRSLSYMSVGFFLGIAGKTLNLYVVNSVAAVLGAILLLYFGLSFLFPYSIPGFHGIRMPGWFNRSIGQLIRGRTNPVENAALMGMVSGLLPCGLLYPAYGLALGTGEPLAGAFIMFVFSLGTYPALMVVGLASSKLWDFLRARWPGRILGIAMILYAVFIVFKRWSHAGQF